MAAKTHQPAGGAAAFRSDRKPPRRGEVERARIAPEFADHGREAGASYPLLHRPECVSGVACLDVDEVLGGKPWWVDSTTFEDRHAVLDPKQWFIGRELCQQESRPAAVSRVCGEQFGEGGTLWLG